jgi:hypothetical protein
VKGLIEIFYEPGKVFDYVRERRAWVAALLACMALAAATYFYVASSIGPENIARNAIENSKSAANLTPEQKEKQISMAGSTTFLYIQTIAVFVVTGVFLAMIAAFFIPIASIGGGQVSFTQALGTVAYAAWPFTVLRAILSVVVVMVAPDKTTLDPQRLLAFNPAAFLDKQATAPPLFTLASMFDLFIFAQMAFAAWGLTRVAKISFSKALIGNAGIWVILTVIFVGLSFLMPR